VVKIEMTQSDSENIHYVDVAIMGAGMVGTALALSLKEASLSIAIIDSLVSEQLQTATNSSDSVESFNPRVSALTLASQKLLADSGVWEGINPQQVMPYQKMSVWDQLGSAEINFDAAELYCDELGFIVENQTLVSSLHQSTRQQENLTEYFGCRLDSIKPCNDQAGAHILNLSNGQQIHCDLLVAADGANSTVRNTLSMATREWDYEHHAIVATVQTEKPHESVARQRFSESGPLAFLPLQDKNSSEKFCSIVWSVQSDQAEELMAQSDEEFKQSLEIELESRLGKLEQVSKRYSYPLRQRHAKSYVRSGVVLIGDAAHTIHPLAGQGVNLGFKDVKALSQILLKADEDEVPVNHQSLLNRYNRERQGDNLIMMGVMEGFKRVFEQQDPLVRWLRNTGLNWVDKQGFVKRQIVQRAMGLTR
jgi:2-octaprenylphenol hydroxylase